MALTKKGSRLITVDGVVYRWRVRGRPTYAQALGERPLTIAVEQADCKGSVLLVTLPQDHPSNWLDAPSVPVLPSQVAAIIRKALDEGGGPAQHRRAGDREVRRAGWNRSPSD